MTRLGQMLIDDEGLELKVYDDATGLPIKPGSVIKGHPTIAIGRALDVNGVTREEAIFLRDNDINRAALVAKERFGFFNKLDDVRQDVIVAMIFAMGPDGVRGFSKMLKALDAGDFGLAAAEMLDSEWHRTEAPARSMKYSKMMATGQYPA